MPISPKAEERGNARLYRLHTAIYGLVILLGVSITINIIQFIKN